MWAHDEKYRSDHFCHNGEGIGFFQRMPGRIEYRYQGKKTERRSNRVSYNDGVAMGNTIATTGNPEDEFRQTQEFAELVAEIKKCLAPEQFKVWWSHHHEEKQINEIANELGKAEGTIKSTLHQATKKLKTNEELRKKYSQNF